MLSIFKDWITRLIVNWKKMRFVRKITAIETDYTEDGNWHLSIELLIVLLKAIDKSLLNPSIDYRSSHYLYSGIRNVSHLFDWTNCVIQCIEAREPINAELSLIKYHRQQSSVEQFLLTQKLTRYEPSDLVDGLLNQLIRIDDLIRNIQDIRYKDRVHMSLQDVWADIFAVIEMLINIGARDVK